MSRAHSLQSFTLRPALAPRSAFFCEPKIALVKCWLCHGEGVIRFVFTRPAHSERCTVCNGGTLVNANAGQS